MTEPASIPVDAARGQNPASRVESSPTKATPRPLAVAAGLAAVAAVAVADAVTGPLYIFAFLYVPVLFLCWWLRDRRVLWLLALTSVAATFVPYLVMLGDLRSLINRALLT